MEVSCLDKSNAIATWGSEAVVTSRRSLKVDKTFMFLPSFKNKAKEVKKEVGVDAPSDAQIWVKGETYRIDVSLFNPLPAPLSISAFEIVQASFQLRCITARKMLIPAHSSITTAMYVIPESCGELTLNQIRVRVGGCVERRSTSVTCGATSTPPTWSRCRVRFPFPPHA